MEVIMIKICKFFCTTVEVLEVVFEAFFCPDEIPRLVGYYRDEKV